MKLNDSGKSQQILIVDDTPQNIKVLGQILSEEGYRIIIANNGIQTLKVVEKIIPDLILLDIMMPEMDGFETCRRLKENSITSEIPVIFLTAKVENDDIIKGFDLGAVDYITKPFNPSELLRRVKTHLELKEKTSKLIESNKNNQELIHILTHDLNNPISSIYSVLKMADYDTEILNKLKGMLQIAVDNSLSIINNVRQASSIEDGKLRLELEYFNLKPLIDESLLILDKKINEKRIKINLSVPDSLIVLIERGAFINSVLSNIISNAVKFSNFDSVIDVSAEKVKNEVLVTVRDHGIGMPEGILNNLFNMKKPTSRKGTNGEIGTGYGMPLVKKFIDKLKGRIEVSTLEKPDENHGTTVRIYLKTKS